MNKLSTWWRSGHTDAVAGQKALDVGHPRGAGLSAWWQSRAGYMRQLSDVGSGTANSIVVACLNVLVNAFSEAPTQILEMQSDGQEQAVLDHPLADLIAQPNPWMTSDLLWAYYIWSTRIDGNAYLYKARNTVGSVIELWPLRPDLVAPHAPDNDPTKFIDYYSYRPRGVERRIPPEDIIHLRVALDPNDYRLGLAPLKVALKQVLGDEEASRFSTALLSNMAVPGVVLTPKGDDMIGPNPDEAEAIKDTWTDKFGADRRGEPLVAEAAFDVHVVSFSPQQMDFKTLHRIPEERISGVLGVPAILAGLGAGLERATYANVDGLREYFTEGTIIPDWNRVSRQLTNQLLTADFAPRPGQRVAFDLSQVRALSKDQDKLWERADVAVRGGWLDVASAKRSVGLDPNPADDIYLRSIATEAVPVTGSAE